MRRFTRSFMPHPDALTRIEAGIEHQNAGVRISEAVVPTDGVASPGTHVEAGVRQGTRSIINNGEGRILARLDGIRAEIRVREAVVGTERFIVIFAGFRTGAS